MAGWRVSREGESDQASLFPNFFVRGRDGPTKHSLFVDSRNINIYLWGVVYQVHDNQN